jgi:hypothetical protein
MTALMLMALMLYINAIKLFHTHPGSYSPVYSFHAVHAHALPSISPDNTVRHIVHGNHCAICDFQLAKDADVAAAGIDIAPIRKIDAFSVSCVNTYIPAFPGSTSGRAPPATV